MKLNEKCVSDKSKTDLPFANIVSYGNIFSIGLDELENESHTNGTRVDDGSLAVLMTFII